MSSLRRLPETGIFCIQQQRSTGTGDVFIQQQRNTGAGDVFMQQQRNTDTTKDSADGIPPGNCHQKHFRQTPQQLAHNSHFDRYSRIHHRRAGGIPYLPDQQNSQNSDSVRAGHPDESQAFQGLYGFYGKRKFYGYIFLPQYR